MVELPESVRPLFVAAGWYPGRHVAVSPAVPRVHPAAEILAAFSGLTVSQPEGAEGAECALDDLAFRELQPNSIDPDGWAGRLNTRLVGVADIHFSHGMWWVAADGRVFGQSGVHDAFWLAGLSFAEAVERSLFGRRVRPLLRPDQFSVRVYGEKFTADSPQVYVYK